LSGLWLLLVLLLAIAFIIFSTAVLKWHAFLVLIVASVAVGLLGGLESGETIATITSGFGNTLGSIGIIIAAGTIIGAVLEKSGGTVVMANTVIKWVGEARSALAMSITGAIVSIPVFCDSGFVILSSLNKSLASRANKSLAIYAVALSMGLYTTHVFVPPTPGPIAAAGILDADIGSVIIIGLVITIPVIFVTYLFAHFLGNRIYINPESAMEEFHGGERQFLDVSDDELPSPTKAFLPIVIPMVLIAFKSIAEFPGNPLGQGPLTDFITFFGNPNIALIIGVFLALLTLNKIVKASSADLVGIGLRNAGTIILITGAGGAFGNVLQATQIGDQLGAFLSGWNLGIFLPFIIAAALKTAQGSSTVAIITTASLVTPLLPSIGLASGLDPVLVTLIIGAGAMTVSHANDSYFWVVSQFSGMDVSQAYRLQTLSSGVAGFTGISSIFLLSLFI